jgi:hypothetical protein
VRVEQWKLGNKLSYRVVGISWGDPSQADKLVIRFRYNGRGKYNPVLFCKPKTSVAAYGIWVHRFDPPKPGHYTVDARFATMPVQSMRWERNERIGKSEIHGGFFERAITIPAV